MGYQEPKAQALLKHISLVGKNLLSTNTLAYFDMSNWRKKIMLVICTSGLAINL